jgi:uncharacterized membrane protein
MDDVTIARAVHVVTVVHWMGGVAFVTAVMLPAISVIVEPSRRLELFEAIEHRFSAQVKVSVPLAGLSGAYMVERLVVGRDGDRLARLHGHPVRDRAVRAAPVVRSTGNG